MMPSIGLESGAWQSPGYRLVGDSFHRESDTLGMGVEPGLSDVFAKYAEKHLFDEIDEIGVRDVANLQVHGYGFAPTFSIFLLFTVSADTGTIYSIPFQLK